MNDTRWTETIPSAQLLPGTTRPFKRADHRALLVRTDDGDLSAVAALCPHEGYPLVQGQLSSCVLTCAWHNFKFDVRTGKALMGDEAVRTFPVRDHEGVIQVDFSPVAPDAEIARRLAGLENALYRARLGQAIRDTARLLKLGVRPADIALVAVSVAYARSEYGGTHAPALALDLLTTLPRYPGLQATVPLAQLMDLAIESARGREPHAAVEPRADVADDGILALVEAEDGKAAEAALRGRIAARGTGREHYEALFMRLAAQHFLDFGHAAIYSTKVFDLLDQASERYRRVHAPTILAGMMRMVVNGTREDTLPPWKQVPRVLEAWADEWPSLWERNRSAKEADALPDFIEAVLDAKPGVMIEALHGALERGVGVRNLANALMVAGAERLRRFDPAIEMDPTVSEGWLFVTHTFTHAEAVRVIVDRLDHPDVLRHLVFGAFFINRFRPLDRADAGRVSNAEPDCAAVVDGLVDRAFDDVATRPIVVAHLVKTAVAAGAAYGVLNDVGHPGKAVPLAAAEHFFEGPVRERPVRRLVNEAIRLVAEGRTPNRLVG